MDALLRLLISLDEAMRGHSVAGLPLLRQLYRPTTRAAMKA